MRPATAYRLLPLVLLVASACEGGSADLAPSGLTDMPPEVHVLAATVTPVGKDGAVLTFSAHNAGTETDTLIGVSCTCGGTATFLQDGTTPVEAIDIASDQSHLFGPNGDVVKLRGVKIPLRVGSFVSLTLTFANAGDVRTEAEVTPTER